MHHRTLALALALVTALLGTAALPALGQESPAPSPSPSAEATIGETDDLALAVASAVPDVLDRRPLLRAWVRTCSPEPLASSTCRGALAAARRPDPSCSRRGITSSCPYAAELAALLAGTAGSDPRDGPGGTTACRTGRGADRPRTARVRAAHGLPVSGVARPGSGRPARTCRGVRRRRLRRSGAGRQAGRHERRGPKSGSGGPREASATGTAATPSHVGMEIGGPGPGHRRLRRVQARHDRGRQPLRGRLKGTPALTRTAPSMVSYRPPRGRRTATAGHALAPADGRGDRDGLGERRAVLTAVEFEGPPPTASQTAGRSAWVEATGRGDRGPRGRCRPQPERPDDRRQGRSLAGVEPGDGGGPSGRRVHRGRRSIGSSCGCSGCGSGTGVPAAASRSRRTSRPRCSPRSSTASTCTSCTRTARSSTPPWMRPSAARSPSTRCASSMRRGS